MLIAAGAGAWWKLRPAPQPQVAVAFPQPAAEKSFIGSEACGTCHTKAYRSWQGSQHARAMQHVTAQTVLGNFEQAKFRYAGVESTFFQRDGKFFVRTDGADGKLADFEIKYTFGVEPLQQYLIEFPDGRRAGAIDRLGRRAQGRTAASAGFTCTRTRRSITATIAALDPAFAELELHVRRLPLDRCAQEL